MIYSNCSEDKIKTEKIDNTISGQIISNRDFREEEQIKCANASKQFPSSLKNNFISSERFVNLGANEQETKKSILIRQAVSEQRNLFKDSNSLKQHRNSIKRHTFLNNNITRNVNPEFNKLNSKNSLLL